MSPFVLHLQGAAQYERIEGVTSFVGEDPSGSFGILAGHDRFITTLVFGLARYRVRDDSWRYLALPRAVVYFAANQLFVSTRHYVQDEHYESISEKLIGELLHEEQALEELKRNLRNLEQEMLKRLVRLPQTDRTSL